MRIKTNLLFSTAIIISMIFSGISFAFAKELKLEPGQWYTEVRRLELIEDGNLPIIFINHNGGSGRFFFEAMSFDLYDFRQNIIKYEDYESAILYLSNGSTLLGPETSETGKAGLLALMSTMPICELGKIEYFDKIAEKTVSKIDPSINFTLHIILSPMAYDMMIDNNLITKEELKKIFKVNPLDSLSLPAHENRIYFYVQGHAKFKKQNKNFAGYPIIFFSTPLSENTPSEAVK